jgi:purine-nucleoside phosphorylase
MLEKINETTEFLRSKGIIDPDAGIILGTGLGGLTAKIINRIEIDYRKIPNFPLSTVEGHEGKLIYGEFGGKKIVAMKGRFHYYEGYGPEQVSLPVRVLKYLGIKCLFLSNAAGGVNPEFQIGDIMVITDHINLLPNPLIGQNDDRIGVRFPDMGETYDSFLIKKALLIAAEYKKGSTKEYTLPPADQLLKLLPSTNISGLSVQMLSACQQHLRLLLPAT